MQLGNKGIWKSTAKGDQNDSLKVAIMDGVNSWQTSFGQEILYNLIHKLWSEYENLHCIFPILFGRTSSKMILNRNSLYLYRIWDTLELITLSANS